jgi:hypothetical protein
MGEVKVSIEYPNGEKDEVFIDAELANSEIDPHGYILNEISVFLDSKGPVFEIATG